MYRLSQKFPWAPVAAGFACALLLWTTAARAQPGVEVSLVPADVAAAVGDLVDVEIRIDTDGNTVGAGGVFLQFDDAVLEFVGGSVDVSFWNLGFVTIQPRVPQGAVVAFSVGRNEGLVSGDALVARLTFRAIGAGRAELAFLFNVGAERTVFTQADLTTEFRTTGTGATVTITGPTPTPTTPAAPTPSATATVSVAACVGDCGADGEVTVDEILALVGIALGGSAVDTCPRGDGNADGEVTVDEILTAVQHALAGCPVS